MEKYSRHKVEKKKYKQYRSPPPPPTPRPPKKPTNPHKAAKNTIFVINKDQYFTDAIKISHVQCILMRCVQSILLHDTYIAYCTKTYQFHLYLKQMIEN